MSMLPPLVESSSSERARLLLRAARADGPRPGAAGRTLSALGVVGSTAKMALAAGAVAPTAGAAAGAGSSSLAMIAAKWVLVGTLSGGALASGAAFVFPEPEPMMPAPAAAAPSLVSATPAPAPVAVALPTPDTAATPAPASSAPKPPSPSAPSNGKASSEPGTAPLAAPSQAAFESPEQSKLLHDIALLDDARRALRAGNAAQAKTALERYEHERLTRVLDREAQVMRDRLRGLLEDAK